MVFSFETRPIGVKQVLSAIGNYIIIVVGVCCCLTALCPTVARSGVEVGDWDYAALAGH